MAGIVNCQDFSFVSDGNFVLSDEGVSAKVFPSRVAWLEARKNYIGSSDAAAVLGENPYKTAAKVAEEKWAELQEEGEDVPTYIRLGNHLEPFIGDEYTRNVADSRLVVPPRHYFVLNEAYPQLSATPDFFIFRPQYGWGVLECKSTGVWSPEDLDRHCIQLQHQMLVTGLKWGVIAWLTFRGKFEFEQFDADESVQRQMLEGYEAFWTDVLLKNPPLTDGRDDREVIARLYGLREDTVELPQEAVGLDLEYASNDERIASLRVELKACEEIRGSIQSKVMALMKGASSAKIGDTLYTRKLVQRKGYEVKPSEYELFSRKQIKQKGAK